MASREDVVERYFEDLKLYSCSTSSSSTEPDVDACSQPLIGLQTHSFTSPGDSPDETVSTATDAENGGAELLPDLSSFNSTTLKMPGGFPTTSSELNFKAEDINTKRGSQERPFTSRYNIDPPCYAKPGKQKTAANLSHSIQNHISNMNSLDKESSDNPCFSCYDKHHWATNADCSDSTGPEETAASKGTAAYFDVKQYLRNGSSKASNGYGMRIQDRIQSRDQVGPHSTPFTRNYSILDRTAALPSSNGRGKTTQARDEDLWATFSDPFVVVKEWQDALQMLETIEAFHDELEQRSEAKENLKVDPVAEILNAPDGIPSSFPLDNNIHSTHDYLAFLDRTRITEPPNSQKLHSEAEQFARNYRGTIQTQDEEIAYYARLENRARKEMLDSSSCQETRSHSASKELSTPSFQKNTEWSYNNARQLDVNPRKDWLKLGTPESSKPWNKVGCATGRFQSVSERSTSITSGSESSLHSVASLKSHDEMRPLDKQTAPRTHPAPTEGAYGLHENNRFKRRVQEEDTQHSWENVETVPNAAHLNLRSDKMHSFTAGDALIQREHHKANSRTQMQQKSRIQPSKKKQPPQIRSPVRSQASPIQSSKRLSQFTTPSRDGSPLKRRKAERLLEAPTADLPWGKKPPYTPRYPSDAPPSLFRLPRERIITPYNASYLPLQGHQARSSVASAQETETQSAGISCVGLGRTEDSSTQEQRTKESLLTEATTQPPPGYMARCFPEEPAWPLSETLSIDARNTSACSSASILEQQTICSSFVEPSDTLPPSMFGPESLDSTSTSRSSADSTENHQAINQDTTSTEGKSRPNDPHGKEQLRAVVPEGNSAEQSSNGKFTINVQPPGNVPAPSTMDLAINVGSPLAEGEDRLNNSEGKESPRVTQTQGHLLDHSLQKQSASETEPTGTLVDRIANNDYETNQEATLGYDHGRGSIDQDRQATLGIRRQASTVEPTGDCQKQSTNREADGTAKRESWTVLAADRGFHDYDSARDELREAFESAFNMGQQNETLNCRPTYPEATLVEEQIPGRDPREKGTARGNQPVGYVAPKSQENTSYAANTQADPVDGLDRHHDPKGKGKARATEPAGNVADQNRLNMPAPSSPELLRKVGQAAENDPLISGGAARPDGEHGVRSRSKRQRKRGCWGNLFSCCSIWRGRGPHENCRPPKRDYA